MEDLRRHVRPMKHVEPPKPKPIYANCVEGFQEVYQGNPGKDRRQALLEMIRIAPLPVNLRHTANTKDPDLARLIKLGLVKRVRTANNSRVSSRMTLLMAV